MGISNTLIFLSKMMLSTLFKFSRCTEAPRLNPHFRTLLLARARFNNSLRGYLHGFPSQSEDEATRSTSLG